MECSAVQAWADFRGYELFYLLFSGDLLDIEGWDQRNLSEKDGANHNVKNVQLVFDMARKMCGGLV